MRLKETLHLLWHNAPAGMRRLLVWFAEPRFAVSVVGVIFDQRGHVLLLKHVFRKGSGWGLPGGFLETGEHPEDALRRELREEAALELGDAKIFLAQTIRARRHVEIIYRCTSHGTATPRSNEIESLDWFHPTNLPPDLSRAQHRIIHQALEA